MTALPAHLDQHQSPTLAAAWRHSWEALAGIERACTARAAELADVETVALGGSLGRLEAGPDSDLDCIVVVKPGLATRATQAAMDAVQAALAAAPFKRAKLDGIYRLPVARDALLDRAALGSLEEAPALFGKRMQLLLDARPVFGGAAFAALRRDLLAWYGADFIAARPSRGWTLLQNDLMRYLHAYAGWQQFKFARSADDSWQLRQAKLRSTRLVTFAGLLFLLGESHARADKQDWLADRLDATPLGRLHLVMARHDPPAYHALRDDYEAAHARLADPEVRARLVSGGPDQHSRLAADYAPEFEALRAITARLSAGLTRFALARHADWDLRFFERWLF